MPTPNNKEAIDKIPWKKIQKLDLLNKRRKAIDLLLPFINGKKPKDFPKLFVKYAFLLYHEKLIDYFSKKGLKKQIVAKDNIDEAEKILLKVISIDKDALEKKDLLNAKIFLAQIYAITKNKKAIPLAIDNYKNSPSIITANRLADVYYKLDDMKKAEIWYKKYENLLIKQKKLDFVTLTDLAIVYKGLDNITKANEYYKRALPLIPKNDAGWCMLYLLRNNGFKIKRRQRI